ncbi:antibiotic biosynthesis monooxygenase (plasmid) [Sphingomonas sp. NY01]|uniref:putative quinol monooxygenase n=1 Tax=Sphingomonas sp. NY01 TaxID=2968057 RepID=UPI00315DA1B9
MPDYPLDVVGIVIATDGQEEALEAVLMRCVAPSRAESGCLAYALHRDRERPARFVFIERWADDGAFAAHQATPHFRALGKAIRDLIASPPETIVTRRLGGTTVVPAT